MENWAGIAAEVDAALKSVGSTDAGFIALLERPVVSGGDPWNPTPASSQSANVAIILSEFTNDEIDGTTIFATDKKVLVSATGMAPMPGDGLTISGVRHQVINSKPLAPAGVAVLYEVQARV